METVNVHEAKTHLSRLLERVEAGEEIVVARNGKAIARLVPVGRVARRPGAMKGRIRIRRDFDAPLPAPIATSFRGEKA
jgi:prevent-host-death family protein